jgi:hypothetical protein
VNSTNHGWQRTMTKVGKSDGEGTFPGTRGNDKVAPIPAVHATTTEPLEPTAAIQAGARSRGAGHHLGAASARSSNIILATGSVGASARMS